MKANELRIGNWFNYNGDKHIVSEIQQDCIHEIVPSKIGSYNNLYEFECSSLEPIPLTEEWLVKFGFEISYANKHIWDFQAKGETFELQKQKGENSYDVSFYTYYDDVVYKNFKYVHQLQNLYFALTGEELTIKE